MQETVEGSEYIRLLSLLKKLNAPTQLLRQAELHPEASSTLLSSLTMYLSQRKDQQIDLRHVDLDLAHMCELNESDKCNDREVPNLHAAEESSVNTGLCGSFMEARSFQVPCSSNSRQWTGLENTHNQPSGLVESARRTTFQPPQITQPIHHGVPDLYEVPTFNPYGSTPLRPLASKDVSRRKNTIKHLLGNEMDYSVWEMNGQYLKQRATDEVKQTVDPKAIMPLEKPLSSVLGSDNQVDNRYDEWEEDKAEDSEETIYSDSDSEMSLIRPTDDLHDEDEPATYVTFIKRALRGLGGQGTKREIARWMERDPDCKKFLKDRHGSWKNTMAGCLSNNAAFFHLPSSPVSSDSPRKKRGFVWCLREDFSIKMKKRAKLMGEERSRKKSGDDDSDNSDSEYEFHEEPVRVKHDHTPKLVHDPSKKAQQSAVTVNPPSPVQAHSSGHSMTPLRRYVVEAIVKHAGKADIHQICQHIIQRMYPSTETHPTEAQIAKKIGGAIARNPLFSKLETYNEFTNKSAHVWTLSTPLSKEEESEMLQDIATMGHSGDGAQVVQTEGIPDADAMDTGDSAAPAEVPHVEPPKSPLHVEQSAPNQTTPSNEKLKYEEIWKRVRDHKTSSGRELALPFLDLPSQDEFPEYYTTIAKPIDMTYIWRNIKKGNYRGRPWRLVADFDRLFTNCRTFNPTTSQLHKDATTLQCVFVKEFEERFGPIAELPPPKRAVPPISPLKALAASDGKKGIPIRVMTGTKRRLAI